MVVDGDRVNGLTIVVDVGQVSLGGSAYATKRGQSTLYGRSAAVLFCDTRMR